MIAPFGHTWATMPTWTEVAVELGPVPNRTASPGAGMAVGARSRPRAAPHSSMLPVNGYWGMATPCCRQTHVANSAHHSSHGPYGLQ